MISEITSGFGTTTTVMSTTGVAAIARSAPALSPAGEEPSEMMPPSQAATASARSAMRRSPRTGRSDMDIDMGGDLVWLTGFVSIHGITARPYETMMLVRVAAPRSTHRRERATTAG